MDERVSTWLRSPMRLIPLGYPSPAADTDGTCCMVAFSRMPQLICCGRIGGIACRLTLIIRAENYGSGAEVGLHFWLFSCGACPAFDIITILEFWRNLIAPLICIMADHVKYMRSWASCLVSQLCFCQLRNLLAGLLAQSFSHSQPLNGFRHNYAFNCWHFWHIECAD